MTGTASRDESSDSPGYAGPSGLDGTLTIQCFKSRPSIWTAPSNFTCSRSPWSQAPYTTDLRTCSSAQTSATVSRRSSGIAAIEGGSERSERVSPASVNGLHSAASADTTASPEGQGGARDSAGLTRVASPCTSSSGPCQGEGRRFEPGVPLQFARISGGCTPGSGFLLSQRKAKVAGSLGGEKRSWIRRVSSSSRRMPRQGREKRQSCVSSAGSRSPLSRIRILDTNFIIMLS